MKALMIPFFILLIGLLGFVIYKDTEMKRQAELNQLIKEENSSYQQPDFDQKMQREPIRGDRDSL